MPELRKDPISNKWVVLATERAKRPETFKAKERAFFDAKDANDPFAEGREAENAPELLAYSNDPRRRPDTPGWTVRAFENKYPAFDFDPGDKMRVYKNGIFEHKKGLGYHEVIVTSDPKKHPALFNSEEMAELIRAYQERFSTHCAKDHVKYVCIIYNHGEKAGASITHPHSQLFAFPLVTNDVNDEILGSLDYHNKNQRCVYCDMAKQESIQKQRVVMESDNFISFMPYASRFPFEIWIMPKNHDPYFETIGNDERFEFGDHLREMLNKLYVAFDDPPYNFYIHSSPCDSKEHPHYHWHLELIPRFTKIAGFELGTGMIINTISPEDAADYLRGIK